jgi:hypothetical protein
MKIIHFTKIELFSLPHVVDAKLVIAINHSILRIFQNVLESKYYKLHFVN